MSKFDNLNELIGYSQILDDHNKKVQMAKDWSTKAIRTIITPTDELSDLEKQWDAYNSMIKKNRRESDWKSIELFGMNNQSHYELIRDKLLGKDIENEIDGRIPLVKEGDSPLIESYISLDSADSYYNSDAINYTTEDVEKARNWADDSDRIIIIPTRTLDELEGLWDAYNLMTKKHRRESDWMSLELFGITNLKHYEYLKTQFLREDINKANNYNFMIEASFASKAEKYIKNILVSESVNDIYETMVKLARPNNSIYEELIINNIISDAIGNYENIIAPVDSSRDVLPEDVPYLSPDNMIDMGIFGQSPVDNYFGAIADNSMINSDISVKEWFEMYRASIDGFYTEMKDISADWVNKVRELSYGLSKLIESHASEDKINARKQSILELGWDPSIEFTNSARVLAKECAINRISNRVGTFKVINLENADIPAITEETIDNIVERTSLYPVYIVLLEGKTPIFSDGIRALTKSIYSHASISFDYSLEKMYSFTIRGENGFVEESIDDIIEGSRIGVYVFFVSESIYGKLNDMIEMFKKNAYKTKYSFKNLFTFVFNIPYNRDWNLICSQFVDRCLKMAGIDITHKDSSIVSPGDLERSCTKENRIYSIYKGLASSYKPNKMKNLITSLMMKQKPLAENASYLDRSNRNIDKILEYVLGSLEIVPIQEAKKFPVQFDKEGNLLIKNIKKIDYEAEYAKSHKLLKEYIKTKNTDGIKYELSKLWMMNAKIEEYTNSDKFRGKPQSYINNLDQMKARAKILNDFKYYLGELMKIEPDFNFTEYYEDSPFSQSVIQVDNTTLAFIISMIKKFIKPL